MQGKIKILEGEIRGYINSPWDTKKEVPEYISVDEALFLEGVYIAEIDFQDGSKLVYPSLSGGYDLYYAFYNNQICYDTDFFNLAKKVGEISFDKKQISFFLDKGYLEQGKTLFSQIFRVELGCGLYIESNGEYQIIVLKQKNWKIGYEEFVSSIKNSIEMYLDDNSNNALLFSGGKDSGFLATFLKKEFDISPILYTGKISNPSGFDMNESDTYRSEMYSKELGLVHKVVDINANQYTFEDIAYLVKKMPLAAHAAFLFDKIFLDIKETSGDEMTVWTGQNADTVYGCGFTGSNIPNMLARYFFTDSYLKSLSDTENHLFGKMISELVCLGYQFKRKEKLYPPKKSEDLYRTILNGNIMMSKCPCLRADKKNISYDEIWHRIWEIYQSAHVTGMDHQVIRNVGNEKIRRCFPFSAVGSMMMFRSVRFTSKDVFEPKRFIAQYLKDFWGKEKFQELYPTDWKVFRKNTNIIDHESRIMNNTEYGASLSRFVEMECNNVVRMQHVLSSAWIKELSIQLMNEGVCINDECTKKNV